MYCHGIFVWPAQSHWGIGIHSDSTFEDVGFGGSRALLSLALLPGKPLQLGSCFMGGPRGLFLAFYRPAFVNTKSCYAWFRRHIAIVNLAVRIGPLIELGVHRAKGGQCGYDR